MPSRETASNATLALWIPRCCVRHLLRRRDQPVDSRKGQFRLAVGLSLVAARPALTPGRHRGRGPRKVVSLFRRIDISDATAESRSKSLADTDRRHQRVSPSAHLNRAWHYGTWHRSVERSSWALGGMSAYGRSGICILPPNVPPAIWGALKSPESSRHKKTASLRGLVVFLGCSEIF